MARYPTEAGQCRDWFPPRALGRSSYSGPPPPSQAMSKAAPAAGNAASAKPAPVPTTKTTTTVVAIKPPPAKAGQPAPAKPAPKAHPATAAKAATPKTVVTVRRTPTQGTRWVVTYRENVGAAERRLTFPALDAAVRWLDGYKAGHPQPLGSITSEAAGATRPGR